ncbi:UNVERIFIED_CONTAM: hypothetical protein Slati_3717300 [Sesamum latifolium]|uniref:DUF4218 domain-containing protein n=1 Tax=Sesamum latifolium TaxID=2727402 RepID=A0AAW2U1W6_9LAMI
MKELRLHGIKSYDCHVFMQKLIPIAFREILPESVWSEPTEVSLLFQIICSTTLDVDKVQELEDSVDTILCNLEKIFLLSFFDSMEYLIVHLPYEARMGGPVQYRWMYPFERSFCLNAVGSIPCVLVVDLNQQGAGMSPATNGESDDEPDEDSFDEDYETEDNNYD